MHTAPQLTTVPLLSATATQWSSIPRRFARGGAGRISWLIMLATTLLVVIKYDQWDSLGRLFEPSTTSNEFADAALLLVLGLSVLGWALGRFAIGLAPAALGLVGYLHEDAGSPDSPVWLIGAGLASCWLVVDVCFSIRQLRHVKHLAGELGLGISVQLTAAARSRVRRWTGSAFLWTLGLLIVSLVFWLLTPFVFSDAPAEGSSGGTLLAMAILFSLLTLLQLFRALARTYSLWHVGLAAWLVPESADGPIDLAREFLSEDPGTLDVANHGGMDGCICRAEWTTSHPGWVADEPDELIDEVRASNHCEHHGIDALNSLSAPEFCRIAGTAWLWDAASMMPLPQASFGEGLLLVGFAGSGFTGLHGTEHRTHEVDIDSSADLLDELGHGESPLEHDRVQAPTDGMLDRIDLAPARIDGYAVRYKHSRAWFVPNS